MSLEKRTKERKEHKEKLKGLKQKVKELPTNFKVIRKMTIREIEGYLAQRKEKAIESLVGSKVYGLKLLLQKNKKRDKGKEYEYDSLVASGFISGNKITIRVDRAYDLDEVREVLKEKIFANEKYKQLLLPAISAVE